MVTERTLVAQQDQVATLRSLVAPQEGATMQVTVKEAKEEANGDSVITVIGAPPFIFFHDAKN